MAVAPELFEPEHALGALKILEEVLVSKLGVRTLDPHDGAYRGTRIFLCSL
jgi:glycogen debranching enzyme